ncbi:MAG: phosphate acyltransferase PlsX [Alphaproteobacteria bacterium]|nr:phosphate acyltransferase PlsX [Alphaproteobacteria bacterium]
MQRKYTIAVDAMGGDAAPGMVIEGLHKSAAFINKNGVAIRLYGDEAQINPLLQKFPAVAAMSEVVHTSEKVMPDDKPSNVIRRGRTTSMWLAIESVRNGQADAVVSAGNTGCLLGISKLVISMLPGVKRPAITTCVPSKKNKRTVLLDLGANSECNEVNIFQFLIMGSLYAKIICGQARPKAAILNIGSEAGKGLDYLTRASDMVSANKENLDFDYAGFAEGDDIFKGEVDVIATDGFSGNVALKTLEGAAKFITSSLKSAIKSSWIARLGAAIMLPQLLKFRNKFDPRKYNGAVFLGLNGIVVKSHGGTDAVGFANAVQYAAALVSADFNSSVRDKMEKIKL